MVYMCVMPIFRHSLLKTFLPCCVNQDRLTNTSFSTRSSTLNGLQCTERTKDNSSRPSQVSQGCRQQQGKAGLHQQCGNIYIIKEHNPDKTENSCI